MNNPRDWSSGLILIGLQVLGLLAIGAVIGVIILLLFWK